MFVVSHK